MARTWTARARGLKPVRCDLTAETHAALTHLCLGVPLARFARRAMERLADHPLGREIAGQLRAERLPPPPAPKRPRGRPKKNPERNPGNL